MTNNEPIKSVETIVQDNSAEIFFSQRVYPALFRGLLLIVISSLILASVRENLSFLNVFVFAIFIITIPLYKVLVTEKDNIHFMSISQQNRTITLKWTRQGRIQDKKCLSLNDVDVKMKIHPWRRNGRYLSISFKENGNEELIKQFPNQSWSEEKMDNLNKELAFLFS